ncbi:MAG: DUF2608 domain-containing protein [Proteobacteria bacterium]|nr:DUF2608 domain-containing protein [Pseudomonadota bacterium]
MQQSKSTGIFILIAIFLSACSSQPRVTNLPTSHRFESANLTSVVELVQRLDEQVPAARILVVFDIDNTLLAMNTDLGSDQWYDWQKSLQKADKCDPRLVADRLAAQGALYFAGSMRQTQEDAASIIRKLQNQGIKVMAETARGSDFSLPTFRELRRNQMEFSNSSPGSSYGLYTPVGAKRPVLYQDGVYLLAGQHKGDMLLDLLNKAGEPLPMAIIVVDDKDYNLAAYEETASREGWKLYSLHYTGVDQWVESFNPDVATENWEQVRDAFYQLQTVFGNDNFKLPITTNRPECLPAD